MSEEDLGDILERTSREFKNNMATVASKTDGQIREEVSSYDDQMILGLFEHIRRKMEDPIVGQQTCALAICAETRMKSPDVKGLFEGQSMREPREYLFSYFVVYRDIAKTTTAFGNRKDN